ncbi:TPA: hypothetical protein ACYSBI_001478 [Morganella morganii]
MKPNTKLISLFVVFVLLSLICIFTRQPYEFLMDITKSNTTTSVFSILMVSYILFSGILFYLLRKDGDLSEMINNLSEKVLPVIFSSTTIFFAIATVLGVNTSNLDLTITSTLAFLISNNAVIGTAYIVLLIFLLSLITAAKCTSLPKSVKTEDTKKAD